MKTKTQWFTYPSENGLIEGVCVRPDNLAKRKPIILCRGGNRMVAALDDYAVETLMVPLAQAGFSVCGTQYAGGRNSEGLDEYGGADVKDVHSLLDYMEEKELYQKGDRLGLIGFSRGAINGTRAMAEGLPVTAAAFIGGAFDMREIEKERPDVFKMIQDDQLFDPTKKALEDRSALVFVGTLPKIPYLLLHSKEDVLVRVFQSRKMAQALGDNAELIEFNGDDHSLLEKAAERNRLLIKFFEENL